LNPPTLGFAFFLGGVLIFILVGIASSFAIRSKARLQSSVAISPENEDGVNSDAILLVETGGCIVYANSTARDWFELKDSRPDLEDLVRQLQPGEDLISLCTAEGQTRFKHRGNSLLGQSYRIPYGKSGAMLIAFQEESTQVPGSVGIEGSKPAEIIERYPELVSQIRKFNDLAGDSANLDDLLLALLEALGQLVRADYYQVTLDDPAQEKSITYQLWGAQGERPILQKSDLIPMFPPALRKYLFEIHEPLLLTKRTEFLALVPSLPHEGHKINSYIGIPLFDGKENLGILELGASSEAAFYQEDMEVCLLLAGQVSIAISACLARMRSMRQGQQLVALADLAEAMRGMNDLSSVYSLLVDRLAGIFPAEIIGFLTYDEEHRMLRAEPPFKGLPEDFLVLYQIPLPETSEVDAILASSEIIITENASEDSRFKILGLGPIATASGIRQCALVPLATSNRLLGYIQIANNVGENGFSQEDRTVFKAISGQVTPHLENNLLLDQARRRLRRVEVLKEIATVTSSKIPLDEVLSCTIDLLSRLINADFAAIYLLDEPRLELQLHKSSTFNITENVIAKFETLRFDAGDFSRTVSGTKNPFFSQNLAADQRILPVYKPLIEELNIASAICVPVIVRESGIGEMMFGSQKTGFFNQNDLVVVSTAAGQIAGAIERATLATLTRQDLIERLDQLSALARISRELNSSFDLEQILRRIYKETLRLTSAECGRIAILELDAEGHPTDNLALSFGDCELQGLSEIEMLAIKSGLTQMIEDIEPGGEHPSPDDRSGVAKLPSHARIRSVLAIPIHAQGNMLGVIYLQSRLALGLNKNHIEIAEDLATQAGIVLGNAYRYMDQVRKNSLLNRRIDTLSSLLEASSTIDPEQPLEQSLQTIAAGIAESTPFNIVLISVFDPKSGNLVRTSSAGLTAEFMESLRSNQQSWSSIESILDLKFKIGQAFFIPYEKMPILPADIHTLVPLPLQEYRGNGNVWHPKDMLLIPLYDKNGDPLGLISVDDPKDHLRPDLPSIESLEIFASQASLIIAANRRIQSLTQELETQRSLLIKSQTELADLKNASQTLLVSEGEQKLALQSLSEQISASNSVSSILRDIQKQEDRNGVLSTIAQGMVKLLAFDLVLVAEVNGSGLRMLHEFGKLPEDLRPEAQLGSRNPMHLASRNLEIIYISDATKNELWKDSQLVRLTKAKGFVAIPVHDGTHSPAVILGLCKEPLPLPEDGHIHLYKHLSQQAVYVLKTINLVRENKRRKSELGLLLEFNRQISSFDSEHIFRILIETARKAVPTAHTGMVLQLDENRRKLLPIVSIGYSQQAELSNLAFPNRRSLLSQVVSTRKPQRKEEIDLARDYGLSREALIRYQAITSGRIPSSVMIHPILEAREKHIKKNSPRIEWILLLESFQATDTFSKDDEVMIASLAEQTALILANARLSKVSAERANQLQALTGVATAITSNLQKYEVVNSILDRLQTVLPFDRGSLWLKENDCLILNASRGLESVSGELRDNLRLDEHPRVVEILNRSQPVNIENLQADERIGLELSAHSCSWLGLPLIAKSQVIGIISLEKNTPDFYKDDDIELAMTFASQAAIALENSRLFDETLSLSVDLEKRVVERTRELEFEHHKTETLLRIITELTSSLELEKVLHHTLLVLNDMIGASHATCMVLQPGKTKLRHLATIGYPHPTPPGGWPSILEINQGLVGWIIANRESVLITDVTEDERWLPLPGLEHPHRSAMGVPIELSGQLLGVLLLFHPEIGHFSADQLDLVKAAANQMAVAINNAELYSLIRSQADELKNLLKSQQIEASRSRSILEAIAEGVLVTDQENRVTLFNESAQRILSIKREHVLGGPLNRLAGLFGTVANTWLETIYSWSSDPSSYHPGVTYSEQISLEDGRVLAVNLAPVLSKDEFFGTVSIFHDITHQIEVDRLKSEFVATVSHELRTPMTSIKGYVDILLMGVAGELNEQQLRFLQVVKQNTERLTILVNDLLDLSRIEAGKANLSTQPLDLAYLIEEALTDLETRSRDDNKPLSISSEIPPGLPRVIGDPERVRQILANLLNNAYHYTPQNGRIAVTAQRAGDEVRVDIADTGIGIPITEQDRVFERFYRGENSLVLATSGTGLGLSIVQQLIHMHHGRIWLRSSGVPGEGCTFSFTLPVFEPDLPQDKEVVPWQESWSQKTNATSST